MGILSIVLKWGCSTDCMQVRTMKASITKLSADGTNDSVILIFVQVFRRCHSVIFIFVQVFRRCKVPIDLV